MCSINFGHLCKCSFYSHQFLGYVLFMVPKSDPSLKSYRIFLLHAKIFTLGGTPKSKPFVRRNLKMSGEGHMVRQTKFPMNLKKRFAYSGHM